MQWSAVGFYWIVNEVEMRWIEVQRTHQQSGFGLIRFLSLELASLQQHRGSAPARSNWHATGLPYADLTSMQV